MSKLITEFPSLIGLTNSHLIAVGDPITGTLYKMTVGDLTMGPQGMLIPRMTTTERNNIATPTTGLLVYDTTLNDIYIYNGTGWQLMPNEASSPTWTGTHTFTGKLEVTSTTQGFLPPRMTTTQRDAIVSPAEGLVIYNTTDKKHQGYDGTSWNNFY